MNRKGRREEGGDFSAGEGKNSRVDGTGHHYGRNETSLGQLATGRCAFQLVDHNCENCGNWYKYILHVEPWSEKTGRSSFTLIVFPQ